MIKIDLFLVLVILEIMYILKNIECIKLKYGDMEDDEYEHMMKIYGSRSRKGVSVRIKTPNQDSTLSPAGSFFKRRFSIKAFSLNDEKNKESMERKESKDYNNMPMKESSKSIRSNISKLSNNDSELTVPEEIANKNLKKKKK